MAKHIRASVAQQIVKTLGEQDGLTTEELSIEVSKKGDFSKAAFFRALSDLKAEGMVVGLREGRHTTNHLRPKDSDWSPGVNSLGLRMNVKSIINKRALALIDEMLSEQNIDEEKWITSVKERAMLLYSLIETYEESKGIRYKRPWKKDVNFDKLPETSWIRFLGYVIGEVYASSKQDRPVSQEQEVVT